MPILEFIKTSFSDWTNQASGLSLVAYLIAGGKKEVMKTSEDQEQSNEHCCLYAQTIALLDPVDTE